MLETREEWACIEHWVLDEYNPDYFQKFAYGSKSIPDYGHWANGYPQGGDCISLVIGTGQGQAYFADGDCRGDMMWGICEKM